MVDYFIFPFSYEGLLEQPGDTRYYVQSENDVKLMQERRILKHIQDIEIAFQQNIEMIKEPDRFDFLYYLIGNFSMEPSKRNE